MALTKYVTFQCMVASSVNAAYRVSPVANHPSLSRFSSFASVVNPSFLAISSSKMELLEVMMRAQEGILDIAAIRQINWDVHLGDMVTVRGVLQRKHSEAGYSNGWLYTNMVLLDGFNACKYYFSSKCLRGEQCHFWHGQPEDFKTNQRRWIQKRLEKQDMLHILPRSRIFCDWIVESPGEEFLASGTGVVDVAGGKGDIPVQLWIQRGIQTTLIDPRPMKLGKYNRKLVAKASAAKGRTMNPQLLHRLDDETLKLYKELFAKCSVLVGMHPDETTQAIVDDALTLRKPFAIVPCCVMSRVFPDRRCWMVHLSSRTRRLSNISGRSIRQFKAISCRLLDVIK
ncbi:hypothetical protein PsorP6_015094 [Peronosclerospora sorghi]|uniref:Uncharacterized protein n=1 Tax=Peronosclerospora sorghi TaxID=230839 RepID=A0ACC0VSV4_9STRA|nr:hypothetical protein PsorP6_015094 [Peronosclerospora sorghi]